MAKDFMSSGLEWNDRDEARSAGLLARPDDNDRDIPDPQENPYKGCRCAGSETGPCDYCEWQPDEVDIIVRCWDCDEHLIFNEQHKSLNDGKVRCGDCDDVHNADWFKHSEPTPSLVAVQVTQGILDSMHKIMTAIVTNTHTTKGEIK